MAEDNGYKAQAVDADGVLVSTKVESWGCKRLSIYNSGSSYIYANINSLVATVVANIAAGSGAVPIAPSASHAWTGSNIVNVALACAAGESSTCDIACVAEAL